jgi:hypothetical protein
MQLLHRRGPAYDTVWWRGTGFSRGVFGIAEAGQTYPVHVFVEIPALTGPQEANQTHKVGLIALPTLVLPRFAAYVARDRAKILPERLGTTAAGWRVRAQNLSGKPGGFDGSSVERKFETNQVERSGGAPCATGGRVPCGAALASRLKLTFMSGGYRHTGG